MGEGGRILVGSLPTPSTKFMKNYLHKITIQEIMFVHPICALSFPNYIF